MDSLYSSNSYRKTYLKDPLILFQTLAAPRHCSTDAVGGQFQHHLPAPGPKLHGTRKISPQEGLLVWVSPWSQRTGKPEVVAQGALNPNIVDDRKRH